VLPNARRTRRKEKMTAFTITQKNRVIRVPERGRYDTATIHSIIDEALICHVGFVQDGQPFVIPTLHVRRQDELLLHGATTSRLMRHIRAGNEVCVAISIVDGIVLAKAASKHSINYRSVVLFGKGKLIDSDSDKLLALESFTEKIMTGRWADVRKPNAQEILATSIVSITIAEASAKIRTGPPKDRDEDIELPVWAGVLPLQQVALAPIRAAYTDDTTSVPEYVTDYNRKLSD
jgi:uncharacterized protein